MRQIAAALLAMALVSCANPFGGGDGTLGETVDLPGVSISLDSETSEEHKEILFEDFERFEALKLDGSVGESFSQLFGGNGQDAVVRFVDDRVNYLLPAGVDVDRRLRHLMRHVSDHEDESFRVMASNVGTVLWMISEALENGDLRSLFGEGEVQLDSSRVGIIQIGGGYWQGTSWLERMGTQVHEARHSDCTGGLTRADLQRIKNQELPDNPTCGHLHEICPEDHAYVGLPACDRHAWGAYAVQAVYFAVLARSCSNCNGGEIQLAEVIASDAASRILVLDEMLSGQLGSPDMSSSGVVN